MHQDMQQMKHFVQMLQHSGYIQHAPAPQQPQAQEQFAGYIQHAPAHQQNLQTGDTTYISMEQRRLERQRVGVCRQLRRQANLNRGRGQRDRTGGLGGLSALNCGAGRGTVCVVLPPGGCICGRHTNYYYY
ncbi:uncharacterized protein LOC123988418 [Osmia bicornis bicornis]|uniref:uncharacterized protein LOC123988418 n=1 Tax=Osmia bicornis bicornis TaxID=1437191 RepID=UPI001EAF457D|nr:uncharacterized protein LOC123988418 [Osmia bicornis bicornis]